ncbi:MAG: type restriction enzyme res subunit [Gemmatimonadetes bacterium]|nr:type restriction enzyme res subunit [Gemmatimonadota bacterium]
MKVTLKDYQDDAVREVLANVRKARKRWREEGERHAFSLTAPTGAGKTVMAAAVFEALFHGDDAYEFDRDPGAVVIWFSDDPSLNEQTRFRLMASADRLRSTDLVVVDNSFNRRRFEPGKIYFLNTQKLGRKSLLVRGFDDDGDPNSFPELRADTRSHTIWDTIRNTIDDRGLTLYLVLDEAHRGMGTTTRAAQSEKSTLVKRLINGEKGVPGIPVVIGISATVERFNRAMEGAKGRSTLASVEVDATRVQESGLLKDTIVLDVPDEDGRFDTVLVRRATEKLKESSEEWARYASDQESDGVVPLMVLQVPNTPSESDVGRWLQSVFETWPELNRDCVAHVFGDHAKQTFGAFVVPHVTPERVQDESWIRVLLAKDAISTGWDCPRAEVMVSFRRAVDFTHITQLLGRMVRTPLARRIPGNDRLNSVDCLLPYFDEKAVRTVVDALMHGGEDSPPSGRVLVNPLEMKPNPDVPSSVWDTFTSLPSQTRPQKGARPAIRLTALAHELAADEILLEAGKKAHAAMHAMLDAFISSRSYEFTDKRTAVRTVEGRTIVARIKEGDTQSSAFQSNADDAVIADAYRTAARVISPDIARSYTEHRAKQKLEADADLEGALIEAREDIGALGLLDNLGVQFDAEAMKLSNEWLAKYRGEIAALSDDRRDEYRQISALSREPQDIELVLPMSVWERTSVREQDGRETTLPTYRLHMLCDDKGNYPAELNAWEGEVLKVELQRNGLVCWYRNPDRPTQDSLAVAYEDVGEVRMVRPDFLFFADAGDGRILVDIVDPHGVHLADALPKLAGLATYASRQEGVFRRICAVAEVGGKLRALELTRPDVQAAVRAAGNARSLYDGALASDYP